MTTPAKKKEKTFFLRNPHTTLALALEDAVTRNAPVFVVVFDPKSATRSKLEYALGYFMEYDTTKRLVDEHFVVALVGNDDPDAAALVPDGDPLEKCLWVVLTPAGAVAHREGVYANPDEGLKRVRSIIARIPEIVAHDDTPDTD